MEQGALPLPGATTDPTGSLSLAEVNLDELMAGRHQAAGLTMKPQDTVSVPRARMVYAIGEVRKPGGYVLREKRAFPYCRCYRWPKG